MKCGDSDGEHLKVELSRITTRWSKLGDSSHFVLRYTAAIRKYLSALLPNQDDADDVLQSFLTRVVQRGFEHADRARGRFRDYLTTAVRNAAISHLRVKKPALLGDLQARELPDHTPTLEARWLVSWQQCLLQRAWRSLEHYERNGSGNRYHTVLSLSVDYPDESSQELAARVSKACDCELRADAFRKQLSRARCRFAQLLIDEVAGTLDNPSSEQIEEELIELDLHPYVRDFLPGN